ncbi:MAG: hypothetical protein SFT91_01005 [Rickettsiaceae bacterium]|nr:hypothetical protein [Rickettsiaceae bacterium]
MSSSKETTISAIVSRSFGVIARPFKCAIKAFWDAWSGQEKPKNNLHTHKKRNKDAEFEHRITKAKISKSKKPATKSHSSPNEKAANKKASATKALVSKPKKEVMVSKKPVKSAKKANKKSTKKLAVKA